MYGSEGRHQALAVTNQSKFSRPWENIEHDKFQIGNFPLSKIRTLVLGSFC
jgi:hypothetical protein